MHMIPFCVLTFTALFVLAAPTLAAPAAGPLKVLPGNPRYFTDGGGKVVFLTGSHTWNNLVDIDRLTPPANPVIDFEEYLDFLAAHHHNCFRLWTWDNSAIFDAQRQDHLPAESPALAAHRPGRRPGRQAQVRPGQVRPGLLRPPPRPHHRRPRSRHVRDRHALPGLQP